MYLSLCQVICFIICHRDVASYGFLFYYYYVLSLDQCPISTTTSPAFLPLAVQPVPLGPVQLECGLVEAADGCISFLNELDKHRPQKIDPGVLWNNI